MGPFDFFLTGGAGGLSLMDETTNTSGNFSEGNDIRSGNKLVFGNDGLSWGQLAAIAGIAFGSAWLLRKGVS